MMSVPFACSAGHKSRYYEGAVGGWGIDFSFGCLWVSEGPTESKRLSMAVFMSVMSLLLR